MPEDERLGCMAANVILWIVSRDDRLHKCAYLELCDWVSVAFTFGRPPGGFFFLSGPSSLAVAYRFWPLAEKFSWKS